MIKATIAALTVATMPAAAESITFQGHSDVAFIRAHQDMFGNTSVEFVAPRLGQIDCVVYDHEAQPLATGWTFAEIGALMVTDVDPNDVAGILCRYW